MNQKTNAQLVADMNIAFNNPQGDPQAISLNKLSKQCANIADELAELFKALGADKALIEACASNMKWALANATNPVNMTKVRDALCDVHVFAYGAHHFMGIDADADMRAVLDGVMTRFIKDEDDLNATIKKHGDAGVEYVYFEGIYPTMVMKSAADQPDAPKGKFLKSASYQDTVFPEVNVTLVP